MTQGAQYFQQVTVKADIWVHPNAGHTAREIADRVDIEMKNACDAVAKELSAPDEGIEVVVR